MKKLILLFFVIISTFYSQETSQTQSIELPDFVITGTESISIPKIQKVQPDFIPLLSSDFFTPNYPNEENTSIRLPEIDSEIISLGDYRQTTNALLKLSAGLETWPLGEFYYSNWSDNFSFSSHLYGKNELEYVKKAGMNVAGLDLGGKYFIDHNSSFLPGMEITLNGNYFYESYNYYGSLSPQLNRSTNTGFANLGVNYYSDPYNNFSLNINDSYYDQKDDEINENVLGADAFYKIRINNFTFKVEGSYKNQTISSTINSFGNQSYFKTLSTIGFKLNDIVNIRAGMYFSESEGNTFFSPIAFGSLKLSDKISLFGEFSPNTKFQTLQDFRNGNRYYQLNNFVNLFTENKFNLKFAVRYEYEKYFEISGGMGYLNSDNNFYFEDNITEAPGFFIIHKQDIENTYMFLTMLFRKGPFGEFYGEAKLQNVTSQEGDFLPYTSTILGKFNYSYNWSVGIGFNLGLEYFNKAYTDYENLEKPIPETINLSTSFYYELFENFKLTLALENLLDDKYYFYRNYRAKPFDLLAGFEFRW